MQGKPDGRFLLVCSQKVAQKRMKVRPTITFDHEGLNNIMTDQFKVRMTNPMANRCLRAGEEVVKDRDLVAEEHQTVDKVRSNKSSTASDQDALALGRGEELDGWKAGEGGVGDRVGIGVEDGLGLIELRPLGEAGVLL